MDSNDGGRAMMDPVTEQKEWIKAGARACMMEGHQIKMYEERNIALVDEHHDGINDIRRLTNFNRQTKRNWIPRGFEKFRHSRTLVFFKM